MNLSDFCSLNRSSVDICVFRPVDYVVSEFQVPAQEKFLLPTRRSEAFRGTSRVLATALTRVREDVVARPCGCRCRPSAKLGPAATFPCLSFQLCKMGWHRCPLRTPVRTEGLMQTEVNAHKARENVLVNCQLLSWLIVFLCSFSVPSLLAPDNFPSGQDIRGFGCCHPCRPRGSFSHKSVAYLATAT